MKDRICKIFRNDRFIDGCNQYIRLNIMFLCVMLFLRLFLFSKLLSNHIIEFSSLPILLSGTFYDVFLIFETIAVSCIPCIILYYFLPKLTNIICYVLIVLYSIIHLVLIEYFSRMGEPLDHVFFTYPLSEIITIVNASVEFTIIPFLFWTVAIAGIIAIFWLCKKVRITIKISLSIVVISILFSLFTNYKAMIENQNVYKKLTNYYLAVSPVPYTALKFYNYYQNKLPEIANTDEVRKATLLYRSLFPEFNYVEDLTYPFLRLADDKDVLGAFFNKTDDGLPPNFVFFIIEGFGNHLTGVVDENAISFTPFIDSLSQKSLYWEQCLTATSRTFGVLPTVFASVPFGKIGFASTYANFSNHNSLLKEMNKNGYEISFYYGGEAAFDGQQRFLEHNKVSYISNYKVDAFSEETYTLLKNNNRWGLDDHETFHRASLRKDSIGQKRPNVDIYLTLSTHEPFVIKEIEKYKAKVLEICKTAKFSSPQEEKNIMNNMNIYACFLYLDDCIRDMYNYYKSSPDFKNTIFVITGDHRIAGVGYSQYELENHSVPLIIHSPLLHYPKKMEAIVSHTDITPSINAYLQHNYDYKISKLCHWLGTSFDTVSHFSANKKGLAFMKNNRDVYQFLYKDILLSNNKLYTVLPKDKSVPYDRENHDEMQTSMKEYFNAFMAVNLYSVLNDYIYPSQNKTIPIKDEYYDFNKGHHALFEKIVKDSLNNNYAKIDSSIPYGTLTSFQILNGNYSNLFVDISFNFQNIDTTKQLPTVVFDIFDNDKSLYYTAEHITNAYGESINSGKLEYFRLRTSIPINGYKSKGKLLKIYLFNHSGAEMIYNNIHVKIRADVE